MNVPLKRGAREVRDTANSYAVAKLGDWAGPVGYKRTELGLFPEDWQIRELADWKPFVTSGSRGWADYYSDHGAAFIRITNMSRESIYLDLDELKFVNLPPDSTEGVRTRLQDGDLLVSITADIGIIAFVDSSVPKPAYINQHIALVRLDPEKVDSRFLSYFLASESSQRAFHAGTDQGAKAGMNLRGVRDIKAAFPLLAEQRAIAAALADVDALLAKLDQLVAKKRDLKQAAMQQLLTGKTRLSGCTSAFATKLLGDIADCLDGVRVPLNEAQRNRMRGEYPYCGANGVLDYVDGYVLDDDVILMAEDGGYFDEFATRPIAYRMVGKCWINNHVHVLKAMADYDQSFLFYSLVHKDIQKFLASGTRAKLNKAEMEKIEIKAPPSLTEQAAIAIILSDMDADLAALEARRAKTHALKQGMMQALLTGRIRLT